MRNGVSLKSVGVRAQGRTTVLRLNYRNTEQILSFAYRFARQWLVPADADEDGVPLIAPESAGRHGPEPAVRVLADYAAEANLVARTVVSLRERGTGWSEWRSSTRSTGWARSWRSSWNASAHRSTG